MSDVSRAYPSPLYFEDRLRIEVEKAQTTVKSLDEALSQLRMIWAVKHREAVLSFVERLAPRGTLRLPEEVQPQVAAALTDLVDASNGLKPGQRHSADQAVSRLIKCLDPERQIEIIWPWMQESRPFRVATVLRTITSLENADAYADYLVQQFRKRGTELLRAVARTHEAAKQITPDELADYFDAYLDSSSTDPEKLANMELVFDDNPPYKVTKFYAMVAAKVLIVGGNTIPVELLRSVPEIFSWAIDQLADPANEPMLVFLIVENHESPELLWSAIRTAQRLNMETALERGLEAARALLKIPEPEPDREIATIVQQRLPGS